MPRHARLSSPGGERIAFDKVLLATGAEPRRLQIAGAGLEGIHYLRSVGLLILGTSHLRVRRERRIVKLVIAIVRREKVNDLWEGDPPRSRHPRDEGRKFAQINEERFQSTTA